jgi:hypothetical protein
VKHRLAELSDGATTGKNAPMRPQEPPKQGSLFEHATVTESLSNSATPVIALERAKAGSSPESPGAHTKRPQPTVATIRAPGHLAGLPSKRRFEPKTDVEVRYDRKAGSTARFVAGLKALIADMRRKGAGVKQIVVEDGKAVPLDGRERGYQFPYDGSGDLFEGAKVRAVVDGQQSDGRIVSVFERQIVVSLDADFGSRIDVCLLRVDNTAMLDALRERLEKISGNEVTNFNVVIADDVLRNEGGEPPSPVPLSREGIILNNRQPAAACTALKNRIAYIWGPPGTGKTRVLSAVCKSLFDAGKRVLICSNTNQAVDQVLNALCKMLGRKHQAVEDGRILRIGRIALEELRSEWSDYVTLDGIVDRLSQELRRRRSEIEEKVESIRLSYQFAARIVADFQRLDREDMQLASEEATESANRESIAKLTADTQEAVLRVAQLTNEFESVSQVSTLARLFKRSKTSMQADLQNAQHTLDDAEVKLAGMTAVQRATVGRLAAARDSVSSLRGALRAHNRLALQKELDEAEANMAPLTAELVEIAKQIDNIAKTVTERAMIIGATATKLYLSPQTFNRFDTVVIDEASMLMLPALFHAAGLAKERVIISGDFRQLPPIVTTDQKAILDVVGGDVFSESGITKAFKSKKTPERAAFLDKQYRMADPICALLSGRMYDGRLHTAEITSATALALPAPFDGALTIVDTSSIGPFVNRDPLGSRYNLMHALAVRNLALHLHGGGFINKDSKTLGICTSYSAQAKLLRRILKGSNLEGIVEAGTVHRFQGDEKHAIALDIPDGLGESTVGMWLEADNSDDDGAKLFNVAISRAKEHLIAFANLEYLDSKLPARAFLRGELY